MNKPNPGRGRSVLLWILAVLITVTAATYQRRVGPTRPLNGSVQFEGQNVPYRMHRSHPAPKSYRVEIPSAIPTIRDMFKGKRSEPSGPALDPGVRGVLMERRYKSDEPWTFTAMRREGGKLVDEIPIEPPGGKVVYRVHLFRAEGAAANESADGEWALRPLTAEDIPAGAVAIPPQGPVVLRFKGYVPVAVIIPHVLLIFTGMLWANRAGLEGLRRGADPTRLTRWALILLAVGGFVFGPMMQWFAFGKAWTGIPFGWDLTDNKTLFAVLGWVIAWILVQRAGRKGDASRARLWVVAAALLTLVVFSIPHSVLGSELDYSTGKVVTK